MRIVRTLFLVVGLMVAMTLGCAVLFTAVQLNNVIQKCKPTAEVLTVAQLAEKGAPENLHVELNDFTFGTPVIETNKEGWECAWLPIEPSAKPLPVEPHPKSKKPSKQTIYYRANVRDQAALDEFVKQSKLIALVTTPLPKDSRWRVTCGPALRKAYPKLDANQTLFLAEPRLLVFGETIELSDPRPYDAAYQSTAAWGGAGLLLFGFLCMYLLAVRRGPATKHRSTPDAEALRAKLMAEAPVSVHRAKALYILQGVALFGILAGILVLMAVLFGGVAFKAQNRGEPLIAALTALITFPLLLGALASARACLARLRWPTDIAVCHNGLRWRQGRQERAFLWAEFVDVKREIKLVQRAVYPGGLVGAMAQMNNPQPPIKVDTVKLTLQSGKTYRMSPAALTDYLNFASSITELWGDDVKNTDFTGVTDAWLMARGLGQNKDGKSKEKPDRAYY
ncbi:MAG: hypothetical protein ACJ8FY_12880 [Gemmataceae bacterium]